jgi:hypothetical protein
MPGVQAQLAAVQAGAQLLQGIWGGQIDIQGVFGHIWSVCVIR